MRQRESGVWRRPAASVKRTSEVLGEALLDALRAAADGSFVSDPEGAIILWNEAAEGMLGYTAADVLGRPCCSLLCTPNGHNELTGLTECAIRPDAREIGRTPTFDVHAHTKAGLPVWLNVSVLRIADARTGAPFIVHLFRDVTFAKEQLALAHEGLAPPTVSRPAVNGLTRRERQVLGLISDGLGTRAMAQRLNVSRATVRNHVQNILLKLDVHSRLQAVAYGRRHGLI